MKTSIRARSSGSHRACALLLAAAAPLVGCVASPDGVDENDGEADAVSAGIDVNQLVSVLQKRGVEATKGHPVADLSVPANTDCGALSSDSENAIFSAVVYAEKTTADRAKFAAAAATILKDWAAVNKSFHDANGFLCAAWNVGMMARTAYILKSLHASEYAAVAPAFEKWATSVAETYWLPIDESNPPPNSKPEVLQSWEAAHISNRTMVMLEATLHVARLVGNKTWMQHVVARYKKYAHYQDFKAPSTDKGSGTTYFVDASGKNNDDFRGDDWHRTAGLASAVQICEVVKSDTGEDLYGFDGGILLKSLEHYGAIQLASNTTPIPFWDTAARVFPQSKTVITEATKLRASQQGDKPNLVQYPWGFSRYLDKVGAAAPSGVLSGGTCYARCSSAAADPDKDGWGWENNRSCVVTGSAADHGSACTP